MNEEKIVEKMEMDNHILVDNFRCPICWEIVEEPWETSCCGYLFCEKCKQFCSKDKCPMCREKNFKYRKNNFAKSLLKEYEGKIECPYGCNDNNIKLKEVKIHKYDCNEALFKCSINDCVFEGKRKDALEHLIKNHENILTILSENFPSLKDEFNKFELFEKLIKEK